MYVCTHPALCESWHWCSLSPTNPRCSKDQHGRCVTDMSKWTFLFEGQVPYLELGYDSTHFLLGVELPWVFCPGSHKNPDLMILRLLTFLWDVTWFTWVGFTKFVTNSSGTLCLFPPIFSLRERQQLDGVHGLVREWRNLPHCWQVMVFGSMIYRFGETSTCLH